MKITKYYSIVVLLLLPLCFFGCKKDLTNKTIYNIHIGETFKLFISENSCCQNCWVDKANIKSIEFIEKKVEEPGDEDCAGCTSYYSWTFKGTTIGVDTIKIARISGGGSCTNYNSDSSRLKPDHFIVTVSK